MAFKFTIILAFIFLNVATGTEIFEHLDVQLLRTLTMERVKFSECVFEKSAEQGSNDSKVTSDCIQGTRIQSLLPAMYMGKWTDGYELKETCLKEKLSQHSSDTKMKKRLAIAVKLIRQEVSCSTLKKAIKNQITPLVCQLREFCSDKLSLQMTDAIFVEVLSIQRFANNEKFGSEEEECPVNVQINPVLYSFGVDYTEDIQFLATEIECP